MQNEILKPVVNVLSSSVASNKTDSLDSRMVTYSIDRWNTSVNDV